MIFVYYTLAFYVIARAKTGNQACRQGRRGGVNSCYLGYTKNLSLEARAGLPVYLSRLLYNRGMCKSGKSSEIWAIFKKIEQ